MTIINPDHRSTTLPSTGGLAERDSALPWCERCATDEFLIYEDFVPARVSSEGRDLIPASVSYSCSVCGSFNGHQVPPMWSPPHWFWYS